MKEHNVQCTDDADCAERRGNWKKIHDWIEQHNKEYEQGLHTFKLEHNSHSHLTEAEQRSLRGGRIPKNRPTYAQLKAANDDVIRLKSSDLPEEIDWTKGGIKGNGRNYVTEVQNQGLCGSCWTFAATACLESHWAIKKDLETPVKLSEQNIIDCAVSIGSTDDKPPVPTPMNGCNGGWYGDAWNYVSSTKDKPVYDSSTEIKQTRVGGKSYKGQNTRTAYPNLKGNPKKPGECNFRDTQDEIGVLKRKVTYKDVLTHHNTALMEALKHGPVGVSINACDYWQHFAEHHKEWIFPAKNKKGKEYCSSSTNHMVTLVGYGKQYDEGQKKQMGYWNIKNSWGDDHGNKGYYKIERTEGNAKEDGTLGILTQPAYPIIDDEE